MEIITVSFTMKVKPFVLDVLIGCKLELACKSLKQFILFRFTLSDQVNHDNSAVIFDHIVQMSCKDMCCKLLTSFDGNMADKSFLFLFPEQRNASSDLNETVQMLIISKDELAFNKVGYI
jgi:hypothetical protein